MPRQPDHVSSVRRRHRDVNMSWEAALKSSAPTAMGNATRTPIRHGYLALAGERCKEFDRPEGASFLFPGRSTQVLLTPLDRAAGHRLHRSPGPFCSWTPSDRIDCS